MRETALPSLGEKILRNIVRPSVLRLLFWENLFLRSCCLRSDDLLVSIRRILLHEKVFLSSLRRISCHFYEVCTIFYEKIFQSYMIFPIYFSFSAPRIIALITLLLCSHVHGKKNETRKKRNKKKKKNLVDCQQLVQFIRDEIRWADDVGCCCCWCSEAPTIRNHIVWYSFIVRVVVVSDIQLKKSWVGKSISDGTSQNPVVVASNTCGDKENCLPCLGFLCFSFFLGCTPEIAGHR